MAVDGHTNEITLRRQLDLTGMLISGDALLTQRELSIQIVEAGGDDLWRVKENQPTLLEELQLLFDEDCVVAGWSAPPVDVTTATRLECAPGRSSSNASR